MGYNGQLSLWLNPGHYLFRPSETSLIELSKKKSPPPPHQIPPPPHLHSDSPPPPMAIISTLPYLICVHTLGGGGEFLEAGRPGGGGGII